MKRPVYEAVPARLTPLVFLASGAYVVWVKYLASGKVVGYNGTCAFCHGDPLGPHEPHGNRILGLIETYFKRNPHAETCPMCDGAPS